MFPRGERLETYNFFLASTVMKEPLSFRSSVRVRPPAKLSIKVRLVWGTGSARKVNLTGSVLLSWMPVPRLRVSFLAPLLVATKLPARFVDEEESSTLVRLAEIGKEESVISVNSKAVTSGLNSRSTSVLGESTFVAAYM